MEFFHLMLSNNITALLMVVVMLYIIYWIQQYRKIILILGSVAVLGYLIYLFYSNKELFSNNETLAEQVREAQNEESKLRKQIKFDEGLYNNSLGYSQNNPGNIRNSSQSFLGEVHSSTPFKKFDNMKHGFRAMTELLHNYTKNGHNTINKIINRWAPSSDGNNTLQYIASVSKNTAISKNYIITDEDFKNGKVLNIIYFMTKVEQGQVPNIKDLYEGYNMFVKKMQ